jgi:homogentisate 1,2-dioxygenase
MTASPLSYLSGFGNRFESQARPGALPQDQNSPQRPPMGLYAEQLSGSAFTAPRASNLATWLYRARPAVLQGRYEKRPEWTARTFFPPKHLDPNQMRWNPNPEASSPQAKTESFCESLRTVVGTTSADAAVASQSGIQIHLYAFSKPMGARAFMNADGDFLFVPQAGTLRIRTELGVMDVEPSEIAMVPRGMRFKIDPSKDGELCSGYVAENFGRPFVLPELGPIGANGLAHPRHFLTPVAAFESGAESDQPHEIIGKFGGELWSAHLGHSPFDVVAWHGNYVPYKYDLRKFNTIGTVSFDHPDPSIFTVLTSPSEIHGVANIDFVIFPPRWMVAENTFRPPYFHRNCMSEYMGLIHGVYDAKTAGGFVPGGGSLHNFYSAHGPDVGSHRKASDEALAPVKIDQTLAFMFESRAPYRVTDFGMKPGFLQADYQECWQGFPKEFR